MSDVRLSIDNGKLCLFQPESRFHAKRKVSTSSEATSDCMYRRHVSSVALSHSDLHQHIFFPLTFLLDEPSVLKFGTAVNKVLLFVLTLFLQEESRFF